MSSIKFGDLTKLPSIAVLIKDTAFNQQRIRTNYIDPLNDIINSNRFMAYELSYGGKKKPTAAHRKEYIESMLPALTKEGVKVLFVADGEYFKTLTGKTKVDSAYGYVCDCVIKDYEYLKVIISPNYKAVVYNPAIQKKIDLAVETLGNHISGTYKELGTNIIKSAEYPEGLEAIKNTLDRLYLYPELTIDIEGLSLKFWKCGISTISFAWDKHNGIAFAVDRCLHPWEKDYKAKIHGLIKRFLVTYKGKLTYHNGNFDMKILIYELWMKNIGDHKGMQKGMHILCRNFDDTKLIAYFATNNAVKNDLKLKSLAHSFAGDYAQEDIKDTSKIPLPQLLEYNLVDCLSTWYVKDKYHPIMVKDQQESLYVDLFKPAVKNILQMELCGMPIDPIKVQEARTELEKIVKKHSEYFSNSKEIQDFHWTQLQKLADKKTAEAKKKVYTVDDPIIAREVFNPGSGTQLQALIYDYLGYEVIDTTDTGLPATGADTIKKLINHAKTDEHKKIFKHLIGLTKANKVLTTFIPAFERNSVQLPDGSWRFYGNFNLGGTQSGRLSSSDPNLQNMPSGSTYGKLIKACFPSPKGWIFGGADFETLEAKGNALLTKDPNRLKVYLDGYDSHCLNAFSYYKDQMPDIVDTVESINSIKKKYPALRGDSKRPTFALQYEGTYFTLMKNLGISKALAIQIYNAYHALYRISDEWLDKQINHGIKHGYVNCAFGLRLRTPLLAQSIPGRKLTRIAKNERRSAGNALSQSLGMLNSRAAAEFQKLVLKSKYRHDIFPAAQIHDAIYLIWRDSAEITKWINDNLIKCMQWQKLPEIQHDTIKMGAELDIFWPNWSKSITLKNFISTKEIKSTIKEHFKKVV